jgi:hypothetical protein
MNLAGESPPGVNTLAISLLDLPGHSLQDSTLSRQIKLLGQVLPSHHPKARQLL